jgi:hypothetical protein
MVLIHAQGAAAQPLPPLALPRKGLIRLGLTALLKLQASRAGEAQLGLEVDAPTEQSRQQQ